MTVPFAMDFSDERGRVDRGDDHAAPAIVDPRLGVTEIGAVA